VINKKLMAGREHMVSPGIRAFICSSSVAHSYPDFLSPLNSSTVSG
jgi:hypothetical protein